jgi:cardiolipin synthase
VRFVAALGLTALAVGCASLPEVHPWFAPGAGTKAPAMVGSRGPISPQRSAAILARIQARSGGADVLDRHLAIEEEVAGQPLALGNVATLLYDGPAFYNSMFDAIGKARDHVNIEFYIIEDDEVGRKFSELLIGKAAAGVSVNLMYDSVGSGKTPPGYFKRLRDGGVKVLEYNPVNPLKARGAWRINNRNHRKVVVVDGGVGYTGGINISDVYSSGSSPGRRSERGSGLSSGSGLAGGSTPFGSGGTSSASASSPAGSRVGSAPDERPAVGWRDTNVRIEGPAVAQLQQIFLETWKKQGGEELPERNWFPDVPRAGKHPVRIVASGPGDAAPAIYVATLSAIAHAEKSVRITMAYFVPDAQTTDALKGAAARGVDVSLVLPSYTDFWAVFHAGRSHYSDLLAAGVRIYERQDALLHAKTIVVDGVWSTVGSSNLDWRSFLHNEELNAVILGRGFGDQMDTMFERDVRRSLRIEPQAWARRPLDVRMKELAARVWEYWL